MEQKTLDCGCVQTLIDRQGEIEAWALSEECITHKTARENDAVQFEKNIRKNEIIVQLRELDLKGIRPLMEGDAPRVADLNAQKAVLRAELQTLN